MVALGISRQVADGAIQKVLQQDPNVSVELLVKKALQML
jgi:Holliday junction resolvasome RuvABC DNA-binding subunit